MQYNETIKSRGGRIASQRFRESFDQEIENSVNRYDLLLLVKRVGKDAGFTPRMIQLLDYYINFTRDIDWEEGGQPIVYQSLSKTALDMGVNERQIQNLEKALFEIGALTWKDSGNHKRYGQRCNETGAIQFAYGVDLTPLASMKEELEDLLYQKQERDRIWMETKRQISFYRSQIRACIAEAVEKGDDRADEWSKSYDAIATQIRTHIKLDTLLELLKMHTALHSAVSDGLAQNDTETKTEETTCRSAKNYVHNKYSKNKKSNELESNKSVSISSNKSSNGGTASETQEPSEKETEEVDVLRSAGLQHITLKHAVSAASDRFKNYLPLEESDITWAEFIDAAYKLKNELNISQRSWGRGCEVLGRSGAALCVLITDQSELRLLNPTENTNAYFCAMVERAKRGELKIHNSLFGLMHKKRNISKENSLN